MPTTRFEDKPFHCPISSTGKCELFLDTLPQYDYGQFRHHIVDFVIGCPTTEDAQHCLAIDRLGGACGARATRELMLEMVNASITVDENMKSVGIAELVEKRIYLISLKNSK